MLKKIFSTRLIAVDTEVVMLITRLVVGLAMAAHGWGKIQNPMNWMGPDAPVPGIFQFLAAFAEFGGGIALAIGLVTRLASLGIAITMVVAALFHAVILKDPFMSSGQGGSYEMAVLYLLFSLFFVIQGPGRFSIDAKVFGNRV